MIHLTPTMLLIEIRTDNSPSCLIQLQAALNNIIASVAESPELNSYDNIPEALCKLKELQSELMLSEVQLKKLVEKDE
jgi:hypothetical protein